MCIIIAKNKNNRLPKKAELEYSFNHNHDGAGFMYTDNGKVIIDKGYMTFEKFYQRYIELCKKYNNFKDKSLVIHCRIGTGGGNTAQNTHPYPLSNSIDEMHKIHNKCEIGIAHNGIMSDYRPEKGNYNDTQEFIKEFVYNLLKLDKHFYKRTYFRDLIEKNANASYYRNKFAILDKNDNLYLIGDYVTEDNLSFSNENFKPYEPKQYVYKSYSQWNDDYYDRDWELYREM